MSKINVLALGGLDEKEKRLYILEIDSKIYILDSGVYEPLNNDFGVQHFIPNMEYLELNRDKIKAIFLSSANRMNIGSLQQVIEIKKEIEIYGSQSTLDSIEVFFETDTSDWNKIPFKKGETKNIAGINVKAILMSSIIPGTFGYKFETVDGNILYLTDYVFDSVKEYKTTAMNYMTEMKEEKNLILITNAGKASASALLSSNYRIKNDLKKVINKKQRIVVALYEDEIINVVELISLAKQNKKKVFIKSATLFNLIKIMMKNGEIEEFPIRLYSDFKKEDTENAIVVLSGTRTKLYRAIELIIEAHNIEEFAFEKNDIVCLLALPQSGNEHVFANVLNKITRIDPEVVVPKSGTKTLFGTSEFDIRNYLTFLNPLYFMPVSGYFKELNAAKNIAIESGLENKNIIIADNGEKFSWNNGQYEEMTQKGIDVSSLVMEAGGDRSIDSDLIETRKTLGKDGITSISFIYNVKEFFIASDIDIQMKGVVITQGQEKVLDKIRELILKQNSEGSKKKMHISKSLPSLNKTIGKIFRENFKKTPTIIFNIMDSKNA